MANEQDGQQQFTPSLYGAAVMVGVSLAIEVLGLDAGRLCWLGEPIAEALGFSEQDPPDWQALDEAVQAIGAPTGMELRELFNPPENVADMAGVPAA